MDTRRLIQNLLKEEKHNYMFFQNLKTIQTIVNDLLSMDEDHIDEIISNGHEWASDHVSTSKDDLEEVFNFLKSEMIHEKLNFTPKYDDNPKLKGKQSKLPDSLQKSIIKKSK